MFYLCSNRSMTESPPQSATVVLLATDELLAFNAVPQMRKRFNGWSPVQQERFILALEATGSVRAAAKAAGMSRNSAYRLRERAGGEGFARSWDRALEMGQQRMFDCAMERAMDGVTTIHVRRGGSVRVTGGPDMNLVHSAFRSSDDRLGWSPLRLHK